MNQIPSHLHARKVRESVQLQTRIHQTNLLPSSALHKYDEKVSVRLFEDCLEVFPYEGSVYIHDALQDSVSQQSDSITFLKRRNTKKTKDTRRFFYRFTKRRIPSFTRFSRKLINNPARIPVDLRYESSWASWAETSSDTAFNSKIILSSTTISST